MVIEIHSHEDSLESSEFRHPRREPVSSASRPRRPCRSAACREHRGKVRQRRPKLSLHPVLCEPFRNRRVLSRLYMRPADQMRQFNLTHSAILITRPFTVAVLRLYLSWPSHRSFSRVSLNPSRFRFSAIAASSRVLSACCWRSCATSRVIFSSNGSPSSSCGAAPT